MPLSGNELIGYISSHEDSYALLSVNASSTQFNSMHCSQFESFDGFPNNLPRRTRHLLKCLILNVGDFTANGLPDNLVYFQTLDKKLKTLGIPYYFIEKTLLANTAPLVTSNITANLYDFVTILFTSEQQLGIVKLRRLEDGYEFIDKKDVTFNLKENNFEHITEAVLQPNIPPKHIIAVQGAPTDDATKILNLLKTKIFKEFNVTIVTQSFASCLPKIVAEIGKYILDPSVNQFRIIPTILDSLGLWTSEHPAENEASLIVSRVHQNLPFHGSGIIPRTSKSFYVSFVFRETLSI